MRAPARPATLIRLALRSSLLFALACVVTGCGLALDFDPPRDGAPQFDASTGDAGTRDAATGDAATGDGGDGGCGSDVDCEDGDRCTVNACDVSSGRCLPPAALSCPVPDACRVFAGCDVASGCLYELTDEDGDGQASHTLGPCGTDCDDARSDVFEGAIEVCDGVDQDCDGAVDEDSGLACAPDLDRDGFGSASDFVIVCDGVCPSGLVDDATDCWDSGDASAFPPPSVANPDAVSWFFDPRGDGTGSYDWNCDGVEEPLYDAIFATCDASGGACGEQSGWASSAAGCGERAAFVFCRTDTGGCFAESGMQNQYCR